MRIPTSQIVGIIPARIGSTRFPGKMLALIAGKPLIEHVYRGCTKSQRVRRWIVATDDRGIASVIVQAGGEVVMTPRKLKTGSDRIALVAAQLRVRWIVNWQGDEWLPDGRPIDLLVQALETNPKRPVATLVRPLSVAEGKNPNRVKVVVSQSGRALYFSRALIPHDDSGTKPLWLHLGAYAFDRRTLLEFAGWSQTRLEKRERLEQLRLLEHDVPIATAHCRVRTYGVDTPEDAAALASHLRAR
ncbi:MAG: 3-deoxy-manno-octulosonate cytidylyltransferase [candidate division Zixibacteria bacterium]|nr:3-deoxy-manno-octulosonate cytidylyltransferase [candidate division Zixibacteria bacterium]